ncbi:hypothetical protein M2175_003980 [Bradyrhizobium elkanii]|nr:MULTISPECIES: hypothetical protein [Bradyrhizobium]MCS3928949.1 hypothetical protein [Bradyrhizobium elkanii]MCS3969505.1 hypothetical protein [Bradyrhizobium japonicum]
MKRPADLKKQIEQTIADARQALTRRLARSDGRARPATVPPATMWSTLNSKRLILATSERPEALEASRAAVAEP